MYSHPIPGEILHASFYAIVFLLGTHVVLLHGAGQAHVRYMTT